MLDLEEKIERTFTRKEWALMTVALSFLPPTLPPAVGAMADKIVSNLESDDIAPAGVVVRTWSELSKPAERS